MFLDGQAHRAFHGRFDGGAADFAVALGGVAIAAAEEGAGDFAGEVES